MAKKQDTQEQVTGNTVVDARGLANYLAGKLEEVLANLTRDTAKKVGALESDLAAAKRIADRLEKGFY